MQIIFLRYVVYSIYDYMLSLGDSSIVPGSAASFRCSLSPSLPFLPRSQPQQPRVHKSIFPNTSESGSFTPQAELMSALVLTGHVGINLHRHLASLVETSPPTGRSRVSQTKMRVMTPLKTIFTTVEDSHKAILAQVKLMVATPDIIRGLAKTISSIAISIEIFKHLAEHPIADVRMFYWEMHDVLNRSVGLREYLITLKPVFSDAVVDSLLVPNAAGRRQIDETVVAVTEGYKELLTKGEDLSLNFPRAEYDHIW